MKRTKAQDIQQSLVSEIVHGVLPPGSALDETVMAQRFGVSRTPIREAIRLLQVSGLVEVKPHCGAVVTDIPQDRLDDMFAVMAELESLCARWAALAMTNAERRALRALHVETAALVNSNRLHLYIEANDAFHEAVYQGAHSPFLAETTRNVKSRLAPFRRLLFEGVERMKRSFAEHGCVVDAIERADPDAAEAEMRLHIGVVRHAVEIVMRPQAARPIAHGRTAARA